MKTSKKILAIILLPTLFISINGNAQNAYGNIDKDLIGKIKTENVESNKKDKSRDKKEHQLSYEEFITYYGIDDTSVAIIDVFFAKRENNSGGKMSFLPVSIGIAIVFPPLGVPLAVLSTPVFVQGVIVRNRYSRKKLISALVDYQNNNLLSDNLKQRVNVYLEVEGEMYQEEMQEYQLATLKAIRN